MYIILTRRYMSNKNVVNRTGGINKTVLRFVLHIFFEISHPDAVSPPESATDNS